MENALLFVESGYAMESEGPEGKSITNSKEESFAELKCLCNQMVPQSALGEHFLKKHMVLWPYACDFCKKAFDGKDKLRKHLESHIWNSPIKCFQCGITVVNKYAMELHSATHKVPMKFNIAEPWLRPSEIRPYGCVLCDMRFGSRKLLLAHMKSHVGLTLSECDIPPASKDTSVNKRIFVCEICGKKLNREKSIRAHLLKHKEGKIHNCEECGTAFEFVGHLYEHMKTHSSKKPFTCSVCLSEFSRKVDLTSHMRNHPKHLYKCSHCNKVYKSKKSLYCHQITHSGQTYDCPVCDKKFSRRFNLDRHKLVHSAEQPYKCTVCGKQCRSREGLKIHLYVHSEEKPYKCNFCPKGFTKSSVLKSHVQLHLNRSKESCKQLAFTSKRQAQGKVHKAISKKELCLSNTFEMFKGKEIQECGKCNVKFADSNALRSHLLTHVFQEIKVG